MRRKPHVVANIVSGVNVGIDPTFIADTDLQSANGFRVDDGLIKKDVGWANFGSAANYVCAIHEFMMKSGTIWQMFHTPSNAFQLLANKTFNKLNANAFTGNEDNYWDKAVTLDANGNECYVFTNGKDAVQKWDGNSANCSDLGGWANIAVRYLSTFKSRLIAGHTTEGGVINSLRIQWSVVGDPEDTSNTGSGFIDIYDGVDPITRLPVIKDRQLILRHNSVWELVYTGGNTYFTPVKLYGNVGCPAPRSVATKRDGIIFWGHDNVYMYDGVALNPLADKLKPQLFDSESKIVNSNAINRIAGMYVEDLDQYWVCVPLVESGVANSTPGRVYRYDFRTQSWMWGPEQATAYGKYYEGAGVAWSALTTTWANWTGVWGSGNLSAKTPTILRGNAAGAIFEDTRQFPNSNAAFFESKRFLFGHAHRITEIRAMAKGGAFSIWYSLGNVANGSIQYETEAANFASANDWTEYSFQINKTTQELVVAVITTAANFQLKWIEPWYVERKRSKSVVTPS